MNNLFFARAQMATSLAFHIVFASLGVGMPLLMTIAEGTYLRRRNPVHLDLCKRWSKGVAILFGVGAVSGTVVSFQLGLLWPGFMEKAGAIIGMPFSLEGFAFFAEAIFLGVYLYGWRRLSPVMHWFSGAVVAVSGVFSAVFVVTANAWMNAPTGFKTLQGHPGAVDPIAAMLNPAAFHEVLHMALAAYVATGFTVASVHAFFLLRNPKSEFHRKALHIALGVACVSVPLQILSGDLSVRAVGRMQPPKLAAMEALYRTQAGAPLSIGGIPNDATRTTEYALRIPRGLSFFLTGDPNAMVAGLDQYPQDHWPDVRVVHWSFDFMVAAGTLILLLAIWCACVFWRRRSLAEHRWLLRVLIAAGPLSFAAIEAGWTVTEVGRQPWVIYGVMRTDAAATPMPWVAAPFVFFTIIYLCLAFAVFLLLRRQFLETAGPGSEAEPGSTDA
jgi:cytochrome d ubiquinol oxidase subunit I